MREPVRDRDRLEHIAEAIDRILNNTVFNTQEELEADNLRYYGIVKNIDTKEISRITGLATEEIEML